MALNLNQLLARGFDLDGTDQDDVLFGTNTIDRMTGLNGKDGSDGGIRMLYYPARQTLADRRI